LNKASKSDNRTCLYLHIRSDTGIVFYVGIGKARRPGESNGRNKLWRNIVAKNNNEFVVEVLCENLSWDSACQMEIALIAFYGRRCDGTGHLCNISEGGEGCSGYDSSKTNRRTPLIVAKQERLKRKQTRRVTAQTCESISLGIRRGKRSIEKAARPKLRNVSDETRRKFTIIGAAQGYIVEQLCRDTGAVLNKFINIRTAARETGSPVGSIWKCINGERKSANCYHWRKSFNNVDFEILMAQLLQSA